MHNIINDIKKNKLPTNHHTLCSERFSRPWFKHPEKELERANNNINDKTGQPTIVQGGESQASASRESESEAVNVANNLGARGGPIIFASSRLQIGDMHRTACETRFGRQAKQTTNPRSSVAKYISEDQHWRSCLGGLKLSNPQKPSQV